MICDLHTHSNFSDGSFTPEELVAHAEKLGIATIALTDHNSVGGLNRFMQAGKSSSVITIPGIEITTEFNGHELHILGLFLPEENYGEITEMMTEIAISKEESNRDLVAKLRNAGYDIDYDEIVASHPDSYINRVPIAEELVKKCGVESINYAFKYLLNPDRVSYKKSKKLNALETIGYLASIGAVPIWAHPFFEMTAEQVDETLREAVNHGLAGMETIYTTYDEETQKAAKALAAKYGLKESGGSDFHGDKKPDIEMGSGFGNLCIPFEIYEKLR